MSKSDQDKEPIDDPMIADDEKKVDGKFAKF